MIERVSSPEERLLRLIRGKPTAPRPSSAAAPPAGLPKPQPLQATHPSLRLLPVFNAVLACLLVLCWAGIVWRLRQPVTLPAATAVAQALSLPPAPPAPPALDTALLQQRQLFQPPLAGSELPAAAPSPGAQTQAQTAMTSLTLMGIVDGAPPTAIIADSTTQKSYFVKEGETFGAGFQVEHIRDGAVTLRYQGVSVELHL